MLIVKNGKLKEESKKWLETRLVVTKAVGEECAGNLGLVDTNCYI